jgi:hypothetical protein
MNWEEVQRGLGEDAAKQGINIPAGGVNPTPAKFGPTSTFPSGSAQRFDPRDASPLRKGYIPKPDGTSIEIDYNPNTGGVFLDRGELEALSKIKEVRTTLEAVLLNRG